MTLREEILSAVEKLNGKLDTVQSDISEIKQEMVRYAVMNDTFIKDIDGLKTFKIDQDKINNRAWGVWMTVSSVAAIIWGLIIAFAKNIFKFDE